LTQPTCSFSEIEELNQEKNAGNQEKVQTRCRFMKIIKYYSTLLIVVNLIALAYTICIRLRKGEIEMEGKRVKDSSFVMVQLMGPQDTNIAGNVHGAVIVKLMDNTAGIVAVRHAQTRRGITASISQLDFYNPVSVGDIVNVKGSLNLVGNTSMEVGVRVEAEDIMTGESRHVASAYFTLIAIDKEGRPVALPPLILETEEERRRNSEAKKRRENHLIQRKSDR
jgi:acyl-CoA hydrolase